MNQISYGMNSITRNMAGQSISDIADTLKDILDLPSDSVALVNGGRIADDDYILQPGDSVFFEKSHAKKGA